jgi:outer membrane murein-binding lipoprotein Lpp
MVKPIAKSVTITSSALLFGLLGGCASSGELNALRGQVETNEARLNELHNHVHGHMEETRNQLDEVKKIAEDAQRCCTERLDRVYKKSFEK